MQNPDIYPSWANYCVEDLLGVLAGINAGEHSASSAAARLEAIARAIREIGEPSAAGLSDADLVEAVTGAIAAFERAVSELSHCTGESPEQIAARLGGRVACSDRN